MPTAHRLKLSHYTLVVFTIILLSSRASAQRLIKDYVIKNAVTLKSISPDSTDYTDLEAIGKAIGDAKIVMLGEQDHGDAATFSAKTSPVQVSHLNRRVVSMAGFYFLLKFNLTTGTPTANTLPSV